jgi:hypothetical protein
VLLTRAPLSTNPKTSIPFDLHVLGTPPAFILSQDQTLRKYPGFDTTSSQLVSHCFFSVSLSHYPIVKLLCLPVFLADFSRLPTPLQPVNSQFFPVFRFPFLGCDIWVISQAASRFSGALSCERTDILAPAHPSVKGCL